MILLSTDRSASSGISLEVTCRGQNKRVSLRGWFPHENTITPIHWTIEEFAAALGLIVPPRSEKRRGRNKV